MNISHNLCSESESALAAHTNESPLLMNNLADPSLSFRPRLLALTISLAYVCWRGTCCARRRVFRVPRKQRQRPIFVMSVYLGIVGILCAVTFPKSHAHRVRTRYGVHRRLVFSLSAVAQLPAAAVSATHGAPTSPDDAVCVRATAQLSLPEAPKAERRDVIRAASAVQRKLRQDLAS